MEILQNIFSEATIYALGWTVIHSLWQGALIALLLGVLQIILQNQKARSRYLTANIALLLVLVCSGITFSNIYSSYQLSGEEELLATFTGTATMDSPVFWDSLADRFSVYFNENMPLIVTIWLLGMLFFMLRLLGGLAYLEVLKTKYTLLPSEEWQQRLEGISRRIPIKKSVGFLESALVKVPMTVGYLKPVILLPVGTINQLSVDQVEAILAHELAHIYRNDFILNLMQSMVEALYYFNPGVWWISANIRTERENCCDDIAIGVCGSSLTYAKALVSLQDMHAGGPVLAMRFGKSKYELLNRVKRILNQPQNKSNIMEKSIATGMLLLALILVSFGAAGTLNEPIPPAATDEVVIQKDLTTESYFISNDSVPGKNKRIKKETFIKKENGKTVEMIYENNELKELSIDGEEIPNERFKDYKELTERMREEMNDTPEPPLPPAPPVAPSIEAAPEPPAPPGAPTAPVIIKKKRTITSEKDGDGNTFILIEGDDGSEPIEIRVKSDGENITLNGKVIDPNETSVITEELEGKRIILKALPAGREATVRTIVTDESGNIITDNIEGVIIGDHGGFGELNWQQLELTEIEDRLEGLGKNERLLELAMIERENAVRQHEAEIEMHVERIREENAVRESRLEREAMERQRQGRGGKARFYYNESFALESMLLADKLIESSGNYKLELTTKKMEVNGKKVSDEVHQKYLRLYKELYPSQIGTSGKIEIEKRNEQ